MLNKFLILVASFAVQCVVDPAPQNNPSAGRYM